MFIKMLESRRGSQDGFLTKVYEKDWQGEVADNLGCYFVRQGWAKEVRVGHFFLFWHKLCALMSIKS